MHKEEKKQARVAILDLYEGQANQGMRCLRDLLHQYEKAHDATIHFDEFDVRVTHKVPDLSYDIYISSGGPGSPLESAGSEWEANYFSWLKQVEDWNRDCSNLQKKFVFFICHSFQLACRHYQVAAVSKRKSTAFGVFPVHPTAAGKKEPAFSGLPDPFYAVDSRDYQVVQPRQQRLQQLGATVLCIEKERPHVPLERAIMGIRFNEYMIGTQFHPEADAIGMAIYLQREDRKKIVIDNYGREKWQSMIEQLNDPDKILLTYSRVLPNFLHEAMASLPAEAAV